MLGKVAELARDGLGGAIYTQTTDVEFEINGLMTYDRKVLKYKPSVLKALHERVQESFAQATEGKPADGK